MKNHNSNYVINLNGNYVVMLILMEVNSIIQTKANHKGIVLQCIS